MQIKDYKNVYKQDKLTIYNIDCMDLMKQYPDKYFDLAIVDPPYGIGEDGSKNKSRGKLAIAKNYKPYVGNDLNSPNQEYFNELIRVSKDQIIWGGNYFTENINKNSNCWIVWDKDNGLNDFSDCELAYTSFITAVRKFKYTWNGMLQNDMKNKETRIHPNQKPVALYTWLLNKYAKPNFKIFDSHLGSGSHAIACHYFGAELIAAELDEYYFLESTKRIKKETSQLSIF